MPALQVRDLPADLYEQLKESARREHRSLAQQTTVLLRRGLADGAAFVEAGGGEARLDRRGESRRTVVADDCFHFDLPSERERRIARRRELFQAIEKTNQQARMGCRRLTDAEIVAMIREDRDHGHNDDYLALLERI